MFVEIDGNYQITIPEAIVDYMRLELGDKLEVLQEGGQIILIPIVDYSEEIVGNFENYLNESKKAIERGDQEVFDNIDDLFEELDNY